MLSQFLRFHTQVCLLVEVFGHSTISMLSFFVLSGTGNVQRWLEQGGRTRWNSNTRRMHFAFFEATNWRSVPRRRPAGLVFNRSLPKTRTWLTSSISKGKNGGRVMLLNRSCAFMTTSTSRGSFWNDYGHENDNAAKQGYDWLNEEKESWCTCCTHLSTIHCQTTI